MPSAADTPADIGRLQLEIAKIRSEGATQAEIDLMLDVEVYALC
jgi:hypothetical protein